jgi:hypothetical protein
MEKIFNLNIRRALLNPLKYSASFQKLNIQIISVVDLPGPVPMDEPEIRITVKYEDPAEIFQWAFMAAKEKQTFTF